MNFSSSSALFITVMLTNSNDCVCFIISYLVFILWLCMQSGVVLTAQKTVSSHVETWTKLFQVYSVWGRVKVDIVCGQPMKTIGWHYGNLLQTYLFMHEVRITDDSFQTVQNQCFLLGHNNSIYCALWSLKHWPFTFKNSDITLHKR